MIALRIPCYMIPSVEELVTEAFGETMLAGDPDAVEQYFAPSLDYYQSSGDIAQRVDLQDDIKMFHSAFPDLHGEITRVLSDGEKVSFLYVMHGTHKGSFEGILPTNQEMHANGAAIAHVDGDQITEYRIVFDNLGMLKQLGVVES